MEPPHTLLRAPASSQYTVGRAISFRQPQPRQNHIFEHPLGHRRNWFTEGRETSSSEHKASPRQEQAVCAAPSPICNEATIEYSRKRLRIPLNARLCQVRVHYTTLEPRASPRYRHIATVIPTERGQFGKAFENVLKK